MPEEQTPLPDKPTNPQKSKSKAALKLNLSFDLRYIIAFLLLVIAVMLLIWKPWDSPNTSDRTISVTGEAKLTAVPDAYVFYPQYQFQNADKDAALQEMTAKSDEIVDELVKLGVASDKIKTDSSGYDYSTFRAPEPDPAGTTYTLSLTITVDNKELAQKVQDYLVNTGLTGSVTPRADFSEAKQKELENQARDEATKEARAKADQSAKNLGFKVGAVKSVEDGSGFGGVYPMSRGSAEPAIAEDTKLNLTVMPGENDLHYSVTVVYYVK